MADQRCYLFSEGYIRMSSQKFTLAQETIDQPFIHLTNNAIQQHEANYGKLEEGNTLSFKQASAKLDGRVDFFSLMDGPIVDIITMTLKSVDNGKLNP